MERISEIITEIKNNGVRRIKINLSDTGNAYAYFIDICNSLLEKDGVKYDERPVSDVIMSIINWSYLIGSLDFEKGFILKGPTGRGKTFLFKAWSYFLKIDNVPFIHNDDIKRIHPNIVNVKKISGEFQDPNNGGYAVLNKYGKMNCLVLDDIGTEPETSMNFGNKINIIQEIISLREEYNMLTFGTTNLAKLSDVYDDRTISRMSKLFQTITVKHDNDFRL